MRHRILEFNGLGNPEPTILNNNKKIEKSDFWDEFLEDSTNRRRDKETLSSRIKMVYLRSLTLQKW